MHIQGVTAFLAHNPWTMQSYNTPTSYM